MYIAVGPCPFGTLLISWVFTEGGSSDLFFSLSFLDHLLVIVVYILCHLVYFFFFFFWGGGVWCVHAFEERNVYNSG